MSIDLVYCKRCGREGPPPTQVDYGGALGLEIRTNTCAACYQEWVGMEVMVINELRLNFMDPKSQEVLIKHMREFLSLDGSDGAIPAEVAANMKPIDG